MAFQAPDAPVHEDDIAAFKAVIYTGQTVEKRGLTGSVRADETGDHPLFDFEIDIIQGYEATEFFIETVCLEYDAHSPFVSLIILP